MFFFCKWSLLFYPCLCFMCFCVFLAAQKVSLHCLMLFKFLLCVLCVFVFSPLSFDFNAAACVLEHVFMWFCVFSKFWFQIQFLCFFCVFVFYCLLHILCVLWVFAFCEETVVAEEFLWYIFYSKFTWWGEHHLNWRRGHLGIARRGGDGQLRQLWQSARLRGVQKLFGQCPNAFGINL